MRAVRARDLIGLPVVSLSSGEAFGAVKDVVISARSGEVRSFKLELWTSATGDRDELPLAAVSAIGPDAIMVERDASIRESSESSHDDDDVISVDVVSESGTKLGSIRDVVLDAEADAAIVGYEIETEASAKLLVRGEDAIAISRDALVVAEDAEATEWEELTGFGTRIGSKGART